MDQEPESYFVYIIFSKSKEKYYVGQTYDLFKRLDEHNSHIFKNASTKIANDWDNITLLHVAQENGLF